MEQKKLYKTIETISSGDFASDKDMLIEVLNQIVLNQQIEINGGRMWHLNTDENSYDLLYQTGKIERIAENFSLKISDYPIFDYIAKERTVLGNETNATLRNI